MNSKSRASYSSRLTEAEKMIQFLNSFANFDPSDPNLTANSLLADTVQLHSIQDEHTAKQYDYFEATAIRRKYFEKEEYSFAKTLSPIGAYIRGKLGKTSQQYHDINALINKIRGEKKIKITTNSDAETISRSEKSYGSQLIYFGDLITLLQKFDSIYQPARAAIKISELKTLLSKATDSSNDVSVKFAAFKPLIASRIEGFKQLSEKAKRIKDMVRSQYGNNSTEYNLVKGLMI
jgi:hypothetical protein